MNSLSTPWGRRFALAGLMVCSLASGAPAQQYKDSGGTIVPGFAFGGSLGTDYSANQPALPNVGANFGGSGVYANYVLLATAPAKPGRFRLEIQNNATTQIVILRDDGTAANGAAPANASVFVLAPASVAGGNGWSWTTTTFKGRVQIYGLAGSQVCVMQD